MKLPLILYLRKLNPSQFGWKLTKIRKRKNTFTKENSETMSENNSSISATEHKWKSKIPLRYHLSAAVSDTSTCTVSKILF